MEARATGSSYKWMALLTVLLGVFMALLDASVVNISLPTIARDFEIDLPTVQWVVSAYLLTIGALLLPCGRLADLVGRKRLYVAGFGLFLLGAILAATAQGLVWLLLARAVQAAGAASIQANGMAIAIEVFPEEQRGRALGLVGIAIALGATVGPIFGGTLVDAFGWRAVFLLSVSVAIVGLVAARRLLKPDAVPSGAERNGGADWLGMASSATGLASFLLVLTRGYSLGWSSPATVALAVTAPVTFLVFLWAESRAARPMVDLGLFKRRLFALGNVALVLAFAASAANTLMMPFYLQGVQGLDARHAGEMLTPMALMLAVMGAVGGRLADRMGARVPATIGMAITFAGLLALSRVGAGASYAAVVVPLTAVGAGIGLFMPSNSTSVLSVVERERYGLASAFLNLTRNTGQVVGVAVATMVVTIAITSLGLTPDIGALKDEASKANPPLVRGFLDGMHKVYLIAAGMAALSAVASFSRGRGRAREKPVKATPRPAGKAARSRDYTM